jgi:hypothetical protein
MSDDQFVAHVRAIDPALLDSKFPLDTALRPEYVALVGQIIVLWSFLEIQIDRYLAVLLEHARKQGLSYDPALPKDFTRRAALWRELVDVGHSEPAEYATIYVLIERASQARAKRDDLAHGLWTTKGAVKSGDVVVEIYAPGELMPRRTEMVTLQKLITTRNEISAVAFAVLDFIQKIKPKQPRVSPSTPA